MLGLLSLREGESDVFFLLGMLQLLSVAVNLHLSRGIALTQSHLQRSRMQFCASGGVLAPGLDNLERMEFSPCINPFAFTSKAGGSFQPRCAAAGCAHRGDFTHPDSA